MIESLGKESTVRLRTYYMVPLPDSSEIRINSEEFQVKISPEYYSLSIAQSGSDTGNIDVTSSEKALLNINKVLRDSIDSNLKNPLILEIYDDITSELIYSGSILPGTELPTNITKKIGVYRMIIRDSTGISGELTFVVQS